MVCVFTRTTSEPLTSLVKQIDKKIGEEKKLKAFVVRIPSKKGEDLSESLKDLARKAGIQHVPLTIGEAPDGPPDYEVAKEADVTVLMWKGHKVKFNHAFKGVLSEKDIATVVDDLPKLLKD